jgi:methyl-accepting chemotaxis protein
MPNLVTTIFDLEDRGFAAGFKRMRADIANAEGAMGKMKAGISGLGGMLKENLATAAIAAGTAIVAFGAKSVHAFQETALEAGKLSDALGISVEDASRLMEVAGDLGVDMGALQTAFQRFSKAVGDGKVDLKQFGSDLVYAKDGSVDAYESFINAATAIDKIKDPTRRATEAQRVFGRSYGEIAELMKLEAHELREALEGVSDAKVIDEDEKRKAREMRATMDTLKDTVEDVEMQFGELLVTMGPALQGIAEGIATATGKLNEFYEWQQKVLRLGLGDDSIMKLAGGTEALNKAVGKASPEVRELADAIDVTDRSANDLEGTLSDAETATRRLGNEYDRLTGKLDEREAYANAQEAVGELMETMADAESSWGDLSSAADDATRAYADFVMQTDEIPDEVKATLIAELDAGNLDKVRAFIDAVMKGFDMPIYPKIVGKPGISGATGGQLPGVPHGAEGGIVNRPTVALIGEAGPEAVVPLHRTRGNGPLPSGHLGGGEVVNIHVDARGAVGLNGPQVEQWVHEAWTAARQRRRVPRRRGRRHPRTRGRCHRAGRPHRRRATRHARRCDRGDPPPRARSHSEPVPPRPARRHHSRQAPRAHTPCDLRRPDRRARLTHSTSARSLRQSGHFGPPWCRFVSITITRAPHTAADISPSARPAGPRTRCRGVRGMGVERATTWPGRMPRDGLLYHPEVAR